MTVTVTVTETDPARHHVQTVASRRVTHGVVLALVVGLLGWFALAVSKRSYAWLDGAPDHALAIWGVILSVWGLLLGLIGFAITWWQLYRTKRAAEAVRLALDDIRTDYATFDSLSAVHALNSDLLAISESLLASRWREALNGLERVRISTIQIASRSSTIPEISKESLKDQLVFIEDAFTTLVKYRNSAPPKTVVDKMAISLRAFHTLSVELDVYLRESVHGQLS